MRRKKMSKTLDPLKWTHRIRARFRLWFKLCPRCNSDAPTVDDCWVCWHGNSAADKQTLKNRWRIYGEMQEREATNLRATIKQRQKNA